MKPRVAVIGAGWSGLACALALAPHCALAVFDAAPQTGGRARRVTHALGDRQYALDNGQHMLIGAYRETLRLVAAVGLDPRALLLRLPFTLEYPDGLRLRAARLPAPLHLAGALLAARGLPWIARLAAARAVRRWRGAGWTAPCEQSAAQLLADQPALVRERVWRPLCLAALNVEPAAASAQVFLAVLRDSLGADRAASDLLLPRVDLSALLPDAAERALSASGAALRLRAPIRELTRTPDGWRVQGRGVDVQADAVVLALPPWSAAALLAGVPECTAAQRQLAAIEPAPIATVTLRYLAGTRLRSAIYTLRDAPANGHHGQWVFDRGALNTEFDGVLTVTISGAGPHLDLTRTALAAAVADQLHTVLGLPAPLASCAIVEKRATIVPRPGLHRPATALPARGLYLAGDAAASDYPSTIEASVRAGGAATRAVLADFC